jgi:hypothetical protein
LKVESNNPPVGTVDLDHTVTKRDDMDVAKEILAVNPYQRIIFFIFCLYHGISWKYGKAVEASCRLMQKPFEPICLGRHEDKAIYEGLERLCKYKTNKRP